MNLDPARTWRRRPDWPGNGGNGKDQECAKRITEIAEAKVASRASGKVARVAPRSCLYRDHLLGIFAGGRSAEAPEPLVPWVSGRVRLPGHWFEFQESGRPNGLI